MQIFSLLIIMWAAAARTRPNSHEWQAHCKKKSPSLGMNHLFCISGEVQIKRVTDGDSVLTELQFLMEIKDPIRQIWWRDSPSLKSLNKLNKTQGLLFLLAQNLALPLAQPLLIRNIPRKDFINSFPELTGVLTNLSCCLTWRKECRNSSLV